MANPHRPRADRFVLEAVRLATALDAVSAQDWPGSIAQALRYAYLKYGELLLIRECVSLNGEDQQLIDWLLDEIRARLRLLERQCSACNLPN